jgi:hypothetical protein
LNIEKVQKFEGMKWESLLGQNNNLNNVLKEIEVPYKDVRVLSEFLF